MRHDLPTQTLLLTYHDIIPKRGPGSVWFDCTTREFRHEINWLTRQGAHFISIEQLYNHLVHGASLPSHPVGITFADNYLGFFLRAYPLLKRRHIPTAMFVHTGYVGSPIGRPKMNWTQLKQLDREGLVTVASQTVTHPADLRKLGDARILWEMVVSKQALERQLGHPCIYLAYPDGKFDDRAEAAAMKAGYVMAFSEQLRPAERSTNIYSVCRYVNTQYRRGWDDANRRP